MMILPLSTLRLLQWPLAGQQCPSLEATRFSSWLPPPAGQTSAGHFLKGKAACKACWQRWNSRNHDTKFSKYGLSHWKIAKPVEKLYQAVVLTEILSAGKMDILPAGNMGMLGGKEENTQTFPRLHLDFLQFALWQQSRHLFEEHVNYSRKVSIHNLKGCCTVTGCHVMKRRSSEHTSRMNLFEKLVGTNWLETKASPKHSEETHV